MQKITTLFALLLFAALQGAFAQRTITGKAINGEDALPMPGVYVSVKETANTTITNSAGNFSLSVPNNRAVIVVSFTGFKTIEIPVGNNTQFTFTLQPDPVILGEVVVTARRNNQPERAVTAMGVERDPRSLPYAVTQISGDEIRRGATTNWIEGLNGKVPGLTISTISSGAENRINVLLRGNKVTLFVIDGVPYNTDLGKNMSFSDRMRAMREGQNLDDTSNILEMINSNDIESITVLPSANAAMLYGSEGANGAILITLKK